jgi:hypothetical protein
MVCRPFRAAVACNRRMKSENSLDAELDAIVQEFRRLDPQGLRIANVLRQTFDQLCNPWGRGPDGLKKLRSTERKYFGEIVEMNLHREFEFQDGAKSNFQIAGADVFFNFSFTTGHWAFPAEAVGHVCLLLYAKVSEEPMWSMGLLRAKPELLDAPGGMDCHATRAATVWLFDKAGL